MRTKDSTFVEPPFPFDLSVLFAWFVKRIASYLAPTPPLPQFVPKMTRFSRFPVMRLRGTPRSHTHSAWPVPIPRTVFRAPPSADLLRAFLAGFVTNWGWFLSFRIWGDEWAQGAVYCSFFFSSASCKSQVTRFYHHTAVSPLIPYPPWSRGAPIQFP